MIITPEGASLEVTGSSYHFKTKESNFVVDMGLFQGPTETKLKNRDPYTFVMKDLDFVIITHAHVDHSGRLPLLAQAGFSGKIFMSYETRDIVEALLQDSANIQSKEEDPLYTLEDYERVRSLFYPIALEKTYEEKDVRFSLHPSGHLLGSTYVTIETEGKVITFSGDLGRKNSLFYQEFTDPKDSDVLFLESTYGMSLHPPIEQAFMKLFETIMIQFSKGHTVIIPAFSIGRTAEILYGLHKYAIDHNVTDVFYDIPIYIDSPLAIKGLDLYKQNYDAMNPNFKAELLNLPNVNVLKEAEQSFILDKKTTPKVIISSSGMAEGGHIQHHLQSFLPFSNTTVIFVGYQAEETVGREILEGKKVVRIQELEVENNATIIKVPGFSGHGDQADLLSFVRQANPKKIILTHGEKETIDGFKIFLEGEGYEVEVAERFKEIEI
ncbi:MBL fold metallo-hydrolase [Guggenheimella bovis]